MSKDAWQNIAITVVSTIILAALGYVFNSIGELKHNQDLHNSAAGERNKYLDKKIESIEANNLKQWDMIDGRAEKMEQVAINKNDIEHLKNK